MTIQIGILGSGSGTNCQSIIDAVERGELDGRVACVISDVEEARILERARKHGIPALHLSGAPFKTKLDGKAEQAYIAALREHNVKVIALAGFMRIVKPGLLGAFPNRILNIHPALLPAFPGTESWRQALDYGAKVAGCTVHIVDAGTDTGPILVQRAVPVLEDDSPETLHARIQVEEHIAYPQALQLFAQDRVRLEGRRVRIADAPAPPPKAAFGRKGKTTIPPGGR